MQLSRYAAQRMQHSCRARPFQGASPSVKHIQGASAWSGDREPPGGICCAPRPCQRRAQVRHLRPPHQRCAGLRRDRWHPACRHPACRHLLPPPPAPAGRAKAALLTRQAAPDSRYTPDITTPTCGRAHTCSSACALATASAHCASLFPSMSATTSPHAGRLRVHTRHHPKG